MPPQGETGQGFACSTPKQPKAPITSMSIRKVVNGFIVDIGFMNNHIAKDIDEALAIVRETFLKEEAKSQEK